MSNSEVALRVDSVGKKYRIGERDHYRALRNAVTSSVQWPFRQFARAIQGNTDVVTSKQQLIEYIWALKEISFEVKRGEVLGIIGPNGAGKTTLLKILSRITEPTEGEVFIRGRVGSLLEVGTGFHPELTGRENIYLNGAILGMRRHEIERCFGDIVDFSGVARFIDTPVKRYSSGMYMRLAFAVAAHLEPEILIVDEVLAVGDAAFQKKCLGKMNEVAGEGRTVLLVSHNMSAIKSLASKAIWISNGGLQEIGDSSTVVDNYLKKPSTGENNGYFDQGYINEFRIRMAKYVNEVLVDSVKVKDQNDRTTGMLTEGSDVLVEVAFTAQLHLKELEIILRVRNAEGQLLFTCLPGKKGIDVKPGSYRAGISFSLGPLLPGAYQGEIVLLSNLPQDCVRPAFQFEIISEPESLGSFRANILPSVSLVHNSEQSVLGLIKVKSAWADVEEVAPLETNA